MPSESNHLRADLYKLLPPELIRQDLYNGVESYDNFYDDPNLYWDDFIWDHIGVVPVLKNLFYCVESEEEVDLELLDGLSDLADPDRCPEAFLDYMAQTLGFSLEHTLSEKGKRESIKSLIELNKIRGKELSWKVFYRMLGFKIAAYPLWKKDIYEANGNYARTRYETETKSEVIGTAGLQAYSGRLTHYPIKPGALKLQVSGNVYRDDADPNSTTFGTLVSGDGTTGTINYSNGKYTLNLSSVATTDLTMLYEYITTQYPYRAARVDLEVFFNLGEFGDGAPFDTQVLQRVLARLEEVRPVHVIVRLLILVLDVPDNVDNFCSDNVCCGPDKAIHELSNEKRLYAGDLYSGVYEDITKITKAGVTTGIDYLAEDRVRISKRDHVIISFSDGQPDQYW
jgi:hypothetical protein